VRGLSNVLNHHSRELAKRLTDAHHEHHGHHRNDHESCFDVAVLRGDAAEVREFAKTIIAERGVTHGQSRSQSTLRRTCMGARGTDMFTLI
jgi:CopG family nickel-responsive transcriptional regulator